MTEPHPLSNAIRAYLIEHVLDASTPEVAERLVASLLVEEQLVRQELQNLQQVMSNLAYTAPPASPPSRLRDRLMQRVAREASGTRESVTSDTTTDFVRIRAEEGVWQDLGPGIAAKFLYTDPDTERHTAIFRMAPGTNLPPHEHLAVEELFVLQGDCQVAPDCVLRSGDYFRAPAGTRHDLTYTEAGTTFIAMYRVAF